MAHHIFGTIPSGQGPRGKCFTCVHPKEGEKSGDGKQISLEASHTLSLSLEGKRTRIAVDQGASRTVLESGSYDLSSEAMGAVRTERGPRLGGQVRASRVEKNVNSVKAAFLTLWRPRDDYEMCIGQWYAPEAALRSMCQRTDRVWNNGCSYPTKANAVDGRPRL